MRAASANHGDTVRLLIASGADVNARNSGGMTALMVAAFGGYVDPVRALLASKADPNAKDNQARTALMAAVTNGDAAAVEALVASGADVNAADAGGGVVLTYAAAAGAADAIELLQKRGAKATARDLMLAATNCSTPSVRVLLASGLKPDIVVDGSTPLLAAAGENCVDTVAFLLDRGADVNAKNGDGWTALIKAASGNFPGVARVLLAHGADPDIADRLDRTAWMYASMTGREEIAALLKEAKAKK
jgi:ankyrin repeat protein